MALFIAQCSFAVLPYPTVQALIFFPSVTAAYDASADRELPFVIDDVPSETALFASQADAILPCKSHLFSSKAAAS